MSKQESRRESSVCQRCGQEKQEHWAVNFADGPHVSGAVLVCPTSTFKPLIVKEKEMP